MLDENEERRNDGIDLVVDGFKEEQLVFNEEKQEFEKILQFNPKIPWYKGHIINQPFGRYALLLERFGDLAMNAHLFMAKERAKGMAMQIFQIYQQHKRSIDAKSSEIFKDKDQNQSALIHILTRNKVEKQYTLEGDKDKKNWLAGFLQEDNK